MTTMQQAFEEKAFGKPTFVPRFFEHARINPTKTAGYGITIYDTFTYIEIKTSGRKDTTTRKARDDDKALFDHAYAKYCEATDFNTIPMEALAGFSEANRFILRDLEVTTVEELDEYSGKLPLASLKLMKDSAAYMITCMTAYSPPTYHDDLMEVPRETIQAQRQVLPASQSLGVSDGQAGDNGSGVQKFGISLDEEGNILEIHGQAVEEKGQQEESVQKAVNFY